MLRLYRGRPEPAGPPARPQCLVATRGVGLEPVGPLPARLLAERGAEVLEARVRRRQAERAPGRTLVAGVLDVVVGRIDFAGPRQRVLAADVVAPEAPRVHLPGVEVRPAVDDPLGHQAPHSSCAGQAVGAEAGGDPEAADLGGPQDELAVGGEGLRAIDQADDARVLQ